jgi:hypothetical protein
MDNIIRNYSQGQLAATPRNDGISSCLSRIDNLLGSLSEKTAMMSDLADRLGGKIALNDIGGKGAQASPIPDNALFYARQIETSLETLISLQEESINRIQAAIS